MSIPCLLALAAAAAVFSGWDNQLRVPAPRVEAAVTIDGVLDEEAWQQAAVLTGFSQYAPVEGRPAENATEVLVFYSPTTIYFGIKAHAAPRSVHATLANRDRIDADDSIQIFLSPFNDGRQALVFAVNPLGIQADGALVEGSGNRGGTFFRALESGREVTDLGATTKTFSSGRRRRLFSRPTRPTGGRTTSCDWTRSISCSPTSGAATARRSASARSRG